MMLPSLFLSSPSVPVNVVYASEALSSTSSDDSIEIQSFLLNLALSDDEETDARPRKSSFRRGKVVNKARPILKRQNAQKLKLSKNIKPKALAAQRSRSKQPNDRKIRKKLAKKQVRYASKAKHKAAASKRSERKGDGTMAKKKANQARRAAERSMKAQASRRAQKQQHKREDELEQRQLQAQQRQEEREEENEQRRMDAQLRQEEREERRMQAQEQEEEEQLERSSRMNRLQYEINEQRLQNELNEERLRHYGNDSEEDDSDYDEEHNFESTETMTFGQNLLFQRDLDDMRFACEFVSTDDSAAWSSSDLSDEDEEV